MRIVVVDDDPGSLLVAQASVVALGHECLTAADGDTAWELIQQTAPDVVVTDRSMPGLDGLDLCRRIRETAGDRYTYLVLLTSYKERADVLVGMQAGADDYVTKPLDPFDLETRLLAAQRVTSLHTELARARRALADQARTDPLTGLRNRLELSRDLQRLHDLSQRYDRDYCLVLGDIDHFKHYNDSSGHQAGDDALTQVARALQHGVRDVDTVYRYGGEEFLILLPETSSTAATIAIERLLGAVRGLEPTGGPVTMSFGIAAYRPARLLSSAALLAEADGALYAAKAGGRDRLVVAGGACAERVP
jgi:diguanylate cyclase (GGDEF)-like protein